MSRTVSDTDDALDAALPRDARDAREALALLCDAAREASAVLLEGYRRPGGHRVEYKGAIDLVTEYDRRSEDLLRARLTGSSAPRWELVAEERGGEVSGARPVLYVDPLDGTTNFAHGHPFFAVSLGLVDPRTGASVLGVVYAPALGWRYAGAPLAGVTRNDEPCAVSRTDELDRALLATGFPYDRRTSPENNLRAFVTLKKRVQGVRRCGSAALDLCLVADGTYDGYWESKLKPWDLAAGAALVASAGGRVSDYDDGPVDVRAGGLVATNGALHGALLAALRDAAAEPPL